MSETVVELDAVAFEGGSRVVARHGSMSAHCFRYSTGVPGLRIESDDTVVELLPYQGQQVWRGSYGGRELTMRSMFDEPRPTGAYLDTYGALLIHCGALAMGNPGSADDHPLHGELPNAPYRRARLVAGTDADGDYVVLAGEYEHATAFGHHYLAEPRLTVRARGGALRSRMAIRGLGHRPMPLMYLAHVNFAPVDGARLVDSSGTDESIVAGERIDPEQVTERHLRPGADGWAYSLQLHPTGVADFVRHRPVELGHTLRWLVRDGDQDALGLALPATAGVQGFTRESEKGRVRRLARGESFCSTIEFGALTGAEAETFLARAGHA